MASSSTAPRKKSVRNPGYRPRLPLPNMVRVRKLSREIEDLHRTHPRFLTPAQARVLIDALLALHRRQQRLQDRLEAAYGRLRNVQWRSRWTNRLVAGAGELDVLLCWLLRREDCGGRSVSATALGKLSAIARLHRDPDTYRKLGRKGAEEKWRRYRAQAAAQAAQASSGEPCPDLRRAGLAPV
jgi:hypothetical protein